MHTSFSAISILVATLILSLFFSSCLGEFKNGGHFKRKQVLLNYGEAHDVHSFIFLPDSTSERVYSTEVKDYKRDVITHVEVRTVDAGGNLKNGAVNVTCEFSFESRVGVSDYKVQIRTKDDAGARKSYTMTGEYVIAGLVMYSEDGDIVSGENSQGIKYSSYEDVLKKGPKVVKIAAQPPMNGNQQLDLSRVSISVHPLKGSHEAGVVDASRVTIRDGSIEVLPRPYRVSSEPQVITVSHPDIVMEGEVFETVIIVSVPASKIPPPVVTGPQMINMTANSTGEFDMRFFNLMSPPQKKKVKSITVIAEDSYGKEAVIAETAYSQPGTDVPDESIHFKAATMKEDSLSSISVKATFIDGSSVLCIMEKEVKLRVAAVGTTAGNTSSSTTAGTTGTRGLSTVGTALIATVGSIVAILFVVVALLVAYRQRRAEMDESDFSRSGPSGVPSEFVDTGGEFVLRDRYARTNSYDGHNHNEQPQDGPEVTREEAASRQSSYCEF